MNNQEVTTAYIGSTEIKEARLGSQLVLAPNGDALWYKANEVPSLDQRFAEDKSLVDATTGLDLITFSRTSDATFVGSNGLIQTASAGTPRFDHSPTTGESLGLLIEEQRTNLLTLSEDFSGSIVFRGAVTANAAMAPDGTMTADLFTENTETGNHIVQSPSSFAFVSGTTYTYTVFLKPNGRTSIRVNANQTTTLPVDAIFDLTGAGSVSTTSGTCTIQAFPNGWYRCVLTATATASLVTAFSHRTSNATGDGTSGIFIWGAQLEAGAFPTSYIPTGASAVTRAADVASISGSNFSSWYRQDEGTIFADVTTLSTSELNQTISFNDGTNNNRLELRPVGISTTVRSDCVVGGVVSHTGSIAIGSDPGRISGLAYRTGDSRLQSGNIGLALNTTATPAVDRVYLNYATFAGGELNGTIRRLTYWPARLGNEVLQRITQ